MCVSLSVLADLTSAKRARMHAAPLPTAESWRSRLNMKHSPCVTIPGRGLVLARDISKPLSARLLAMAAKQPPYHLAPRPRHLALATSPPHHIASGCDDKRASSSAQSEATCAARGRP
mmetsp:Transcript_52537/g.87150  ORF Transcript_52537/g.87150 Transcript_52537/m.87150 type:complete len:118 (+) Transcript_52537:321-674(+)